MKRLFSVFLSVLFAVSALLCPVTAAASQLLQVVVPCVEAKPGDLVKVPIRIENNPGIVSVKVQLAFPWASLTLKSLEAADFQGVSFSPLTNNPITVNWVDSLNSNNTTNGVLANLTFLVAETATKGELPLTLSANPNDIFDFDMVNQPCTMVNGAITVSTQELPPVSTPQDPPVSEPDIPVVSDPKEPSVSEPSIPPVSQPDITPGNPSNPPANKPVDPPGDVSVMGDVEADGQVNAKDALAVLKITVSKLIPTQTQITLADVNKDNIVNAKDALEILKYVVGKPSCLAK